jgi:hypothetical protein
MAGSFWSSKPKVLSGWLFPAVQPTTTQFYNHQPGSRSPRPRCARRSHHLPRPKWRGRTNHDGRSCGR